MSRFKSYGFWTAFAGAVIVFLNALGDLFGFKIESELINNLIMAFAGVLVAVGVVSMGENKKEDLSQKSDESANENTTTEELLEEDKSEDKTDQQQK